MCGRYSLAKTPKDELGRVGITDSADMDPRYNIAPGQYVAAVINDPERNGRRSLRALEWGLIPPWINAQITSVRELRPHLGPYPEAALTAYPGGTRVDPPD